MSIRLTGNPAKATRITPPPIRVPPVDLTQGERFYRAMPRFGDLDLEERTFRAVVATSTPVLRKDAKGAFLEILDPAGLQFNADDDFPLLADHRQSARETVGRASGLVIDGLASAPLCDLGKPTTSNRFFSA